MVETANPLTKFYRQPSIYITLPTRGKYYGADVFTSTETGEIPILPMTARDELLFKTPDAMMNGQATVDVIKSCVPNFRDPWQIVNYDIDVILIAIRIATYGELMDIDFRVPVTNESMVQSVNLPTLLEQLKNKSITESFKTPDGMEIFVKPLSYKTLTKVQQAQFEQEKLYATVSNSNLTDLEKSQLFVKRYYALNTINFDLLSESIAKIKLTDGTEVVDAKQIKDFVDNANAKNINQIQKQLGEVRSQTQLPPLTINATEEQIRKGVPATYQIPITFDNSNFFV